MGDMTLVIGGARSGKSAYAQALAESLPLPRVFVATCPVLDNEMAARIDRHRRDRAGKGWQTTEVPLGIAETITDAETGCTILVDCLTLWVNNVMYDAEASGGTINEDQIAERCAIILAASREHEGKVVFVTNEVGMGIVPDPPLARRFRDLAGRCNRVMAEAANRVVLLCAGVPIVLKGQ